MDGFEINTTIIERMNNMEVEIPHFNLMIGTIGVLVLLALFYYDIKAMRSHYE